MKSGNLQPKRKAKPNMVLPKLKKVQKKRSHHSKEHVVISGNFSPINNARKKSFFAINEQDFLLKTIIHEKVQQRRLSSKNQILGFFFSSIKYLRNIRFSQIKQKLNILSRFSTKRPRAAKLLKVLWKAVLVRRFIRNLKWRSRSRHISLISEREIVLFNDKTYFPQDLSLKKERILCLEFKEGFPLKRLLNLLSRCCSIIPTIRPDKKMKIIWDLIIILIISLYFYIIPMQLSFDMFYDEELEHFFHKHHFNSKLAKFLELFPEMMLITDSLLKCITGFYENGVVIEEKSAIIRHYLHKGLIFDILSYLPVIIQSIVKQLPGVSEIVKFLQLLLFFKIKRVKTAIMNYEEIIAANGKHDFALSFCKMMYVILFITHLNACMWHAIAFFNPGETWLDFAGLREDHWTERYIYSLYWAISTMATIGFGQKISPINMGECVLGGAILIISVLLFGYCINSMKQLLDLMCFEENEYKSTKYLQTLKIKP